MRKLTLLFLAVGSFSLQAQNDRSGEFDDWDNNNDGYVTNNEFENTWEDDNYFVNWDMDQDGSITEDEWNDGVETYFEGTDGWDDNGNNSFAAWDQDNNGELNEDEFTEGTYDTWDENDNDRIEDDEYNDYYTYEETDRWMNDNDQY